MFTKNEKGFISGVADVKEYVPQGTRYKRFGDRDGIKSTLDRPRFQDAVDQEVKNFGGGEYSFKLVDQDGNDVIDDTPLNFGGKLHYSNGNGIFRVLDNNFVEEQYQKHKEQEETVNHLLKRCLISDTTCRMLLGKDGFAKLKKDSKYPANTDPEIANANGHPNFINSLSEESVLYSLGVSKLRLIIKDYLPILENCTPAAIKNDD